MQSVPTRPAVTGQQFREDIIPTARPVLFPGQCSNWPAVQAALSSTEALRQALLAHDAGVPFQLFVGPPEIKGRIFYNHDLSGFNFQCIRVTLTELFDRLNAEQDNPDPPTLYSGAQRAARHLPGFCAINAPGDLIDGLPQPLMMTSWIGNRALVAAHFDYTSSMVCVIAGRRRVTLFPPDQTKNLYIGPIEFTPASQPVSMPDLREPDFIRYPRLKEAFAAAQSVEMGPGDILFIPALWWHQIESLAPINVMLNYRWRDCPEYLDAPSHALMAALIGLRDLPEEQRKGWREIFDHLIFQTAGKPYDHLPPERRGMFGNPLSPEDVQRVKAMLAEAYKP